MVDKIGTGFSDCMTEGVTKLIISLPCNFGKGRFIVFTIVTYTITDKEEEKK